MSAPAPPLLETIGLGKTYGSFVANEDISLRLAAGTIHALLGENGAGKSTLVKSLYGIHRPTNGEIRWHGAPVTLRSPLHARSLGIGMVFQHFSLFDAMTVAENVALGLPRDWSLARTAAQLADVSASYGLALKPQAVVADLSPGERQRIEIVRCLMQKPELIILDEPTSVLTPQEAEDLFTMLETLTAEGKSILYISHKLEEVRRLCQDATILRHGRVVGTCQPQSVTAADIARMMVGDVVTTAQRETRAQAPSAVAVQVKGLSLPAESLFGVALKDISFALPAGQISAIAGIAGNGQSELFNALSGERLARTPGTITFRDQPVGRIGIIARRRMGADFVSEDRLGHATAPELSLSDNVFVTRAQTDDDLLTAGFLRRGAARRLVARIRAAFDVRAAQADPPAASLSGGNLQKFIIGRAVDRRPGILIIHQPTWGVDAGAAAHIRRELMALAAEGTALLVISQDLDEIFEIADRIAVLRHGALTPFLPTTDLDAEKIGLLMAEADGSPGAAGTKRGRTPHAA